LKMKVSNFIYAFACVCVYMYVCEFANVFINLFVWYACISLSLAGP